MTIIKVDPPYKPLVQMTLCCAPCAFLWVLHRRGYWVDQEEIAEYSKVHVPRDRAKAFMKKIVISKKHKGVISKLDVYITKLLKDKNLPFEIKFNLISRIKDPKKFVIGNLMKGHDLILCVYSTPFKRYTFDNGHCLVVSEFDTKTEKLTLGDPSQVYSKFWEVPLKKVVSAMDKKYDGNERGFYVVKPK